MYDGNNTYERIIMRIFFSFKKEGKNVRYRKVYYFTRYDKVKL